MVCVEKSQNIQYTVNDCDTDTLLMTLKKENYQFEQLRNLDTAIMNNNCKVLVVDLSEVLEMSTATLAQLVALKRKLEARGIKMYVRGLQLQPRDLCHLLKLDNILIRESFNAQIKYVTG